MGTMFGYNTASRDVLAGTDAIREMERLCRKHDLAYSETCYSLTFTGNNGFDVSMPGRNPKDDLAKLLEALRDAGREGKAQP